MTAIRAFLNIEVRSLFAFTLVWITQNGAGFDSTFLKDLRKHCNDGPEGVLRN